MTNGPAKADHQAFYLRGIKIELDLVCCCFIIPNIVLARPLPALEPPSTDAYLGLEPAAQGISPDALMPKANH